MGRPPKKTIEQIEKEILQENNGVGVEKYAEVALLDKKPETDEPNTFNDDPEYTLQVIADSSFDTDITRLPKPDPNYQYYFIRNEAKNISKKTSALLYQMGGWQICPASHCERIGIKKEMLGPDGAYHVGELILAFMPKKFYEKKKAEEKRMTDERSAGVRKTMKEGVEGVIPATDKVESIGLKTKEQLKMS